MKVDAERIFHRVKSKILLTSGNEHADDPDASKDKWIVIAFGAICVVVLVVCFIMIIMTTIRRRRER